MNELTIASVYHSSVSKKFLELNRELTKALNARGDWSWLVADNTPPDFTDYLDPKRFQVIKALPFKEFTATLEPWQMPFRTSLHHAHAVNLSLPHIKTRFALILDGDFYIVLPEWIETVLSYMKQHNIALLGVPWHPRWWKKVRYFPAHHALFIDTEQLPLSELDFRPQYTSAEDVEAEQNAPVSHVWPALLKPLINVFEGRMRIASSKDTSFAIYKKYKDGPLRTETITPVFNPQSSKSVFRVLVESVVPDTLSYIPRRSSYTTRGFKERGYFDADKEGWEEFVWHDKPFGFHVRATPGGATRDRNEELDVLEKGIMSTIKQLGVHRK